MSDLKEILLNRNVVVPKDYETFKNIFRHFKGKNVGEIKGDDGPLMDRADEFYVKSPAEGGILQGDIIENVPTAWIQSDENGVLGAYSSATSYAMVISNECDCEKRENGTEQTYIRLCPVMNQDDVLEGSPTDRKDDIKGKLERNQYTEYFWMPAPGTDEDALIADFSHFFSVSLKDLYSKIENGTVKRKISLSQEGYFLFLIKMAWFMLRPAAPDTARKDLEPWNFE